ncbi:hypothetical protein EIP86_010098 [Pleurotus ostreatoroseus]|nr:hypothetical protein EIP86_010098 [Pleurotus ostreatoroseus]
MILPEDHPASPPKARDPLPAADPEAAPPPAYDEHQPLNPAAAASTSQTTRPTASVPIYVPAPALYPPGEFEPEPAGKRFFRAFAVALLVWVLFAVAVDSVVEATWRHYPRRRTEVDHGGDWQDRPGHPDHPRKPLPGPGRPADGRMLNCTEHAMDWTHERGHATTSFDLPLDSDALYVFARGSQVAGTIVVTQDEREHDPHKVHFDVAAVHSTPAFLEHISVCAMERRRGERGIGIFTPYNAPNNRHMPTLDFEITVRLPKLGDRDRLELNKFETRLPMFTHQLAELGERVHFQTLDLQSQYSSISSLSVNATKLAIRTSNAPIRGVYQASQSLLLSTTNGVIDAHVTLQAEDDIAPAEASLETSNAPILSHFTLASAGAEGEGGMFKIRTITTNERLSVDVDRAPLSSKLDLVAQTSNSPARVRLDTTFEGTFVASTSNAAAKVDWSRADPAGLNRDRRVTSYAYPGHVQGTVAWDYEHMGRVEVRTTNAPVVLNF